MSAARAAFLREMGLSEDDLHDATPIPTAGTAPKPPSRGNSNVYSSESPSSSGILKQSSFRGSTSYDSPAAPPPRRMSASFTPDAVPQPPQRTTSSSSSRAAFLAAMGLSESDVGSGSTSSYDQQQTTTPVMSPEQHRSGYRSIPLHELGGGHDEFPMPPSGTAASTPPSSGLPPQFGRRRSKVPVDPSLDAEAANVTNPSVDQLKAFGNRYYDLGDFRKAVRYYSSAIKQDEDNAILYSNRSAAYLQGSEQLGMDTTSMALRDAVKACELRPDWAKAWMRRGDALVQMNKVRDAEEAYRKCLEFDPKNARAKSQLEACASGCYGKDTNTIRTPRTAGNLNDMVSKLNNDLSSSRKMSGKDYLAAQLDKFRESKRRGGGDGQENTPTADMIAEQTGFTHNMANTYKEGLLNSFRVRKGSANSSKMSSMSSSYY